MIAKIRHLIRVAASKRREKRKEVERSPHWSTVRDHYLRDNGECAACGGAKHLQVHHKQPYHLHPELELVPENLITLCMGPKECHLVIGHLGDFKSFNPNVEADARKARDG